MGDSLASNLIIIAIIPVIGYWFLSTWNYSKFSIKWDSNHLILRSAYCGWIIFIYPYTIATLAIEIAQNLIAPAADPPAADPPAADPPAADPPAADPPAADPPAADPPAADPPAADPPAADPGFTVDMSFFNFDPLEYMRNILVTIILLLPYLLNCFYNESKYRRRAIQRHGESLYLTFLEAYSNQDLVEVKLKNGEALVGYSLEPSSLKYVDLLPNDVVETNDINSESLSKLLPYQVNVKVEEIVTARRIRPDSLERATN